MLDTKVMHQNCYTSLFRIDVDITRSTTVASEQYENQSIHTRVHILNGLNGLKSKVG